MVVGRAGRRRQALQRDRDRRLLHALGGQAARLRGEVRLPRRRELRGDPRGRIDRGDRQHHAQQRASRDHPAGGRGRQARLPRQADRQHGRRGRRDRATLPGGRRRARARLSAPAREPFPLDQGRDRRRPLRQAGAGRGQHQPRPARQDRPLVVALSGGRHAGRRHAADRHPLRRRAGNADGPGRARLRHARAARAAGRQSRRRQPDARARERRDLQPDRVLCVGVRVLHDEHLRQGGERLLRSVLGPAPPASAARAAAQPIATEENDTIREELEEFVRCVRTGAQARDRRLLGDAQSRRHQGRRAAAPARAARSTSPTMLASGE